MKNVQFVCGIVAVAVIVIGCGSEKPQETSALNYDDMIFLDAEELGEGSIGDSYKTDIIPVLQQYVEAPAEIVEDLDPNTASYKVTSQGQTYVIASPGMDLSEGQNWGNAAFALFDIVNRQLQNSSVKFYAINGGNDLGGMFLTEETYNQAIKSLNRKMDWAYIPTAEHPWYGQPHDQ
jgi:hypothetical protein